MLLSSMAPASEVLRDHLEHVVPLAPQHRTRRVERHAGGGGRIDEGWNDELHRLDLDVKQGRTGLLEKRGDRAFELRGAIDLGAPKPHRPGDGSEIRILQVGVEAYHTLGLLLDLD